MTWEPELEEIRRRRELAKEMGGTERVGRHVAEGRTPVRDRIDQLLDDGSFREIGSLTSKVEYDEEGRISRYTPSNFVTGRGTIDGRPVIIGCDDFTLFEVVQRTAQSATRWAGASEPPRSYDSRSCALSTAPGAVAVSGRTPR